MTLNEDTVIGTHCGSVFNCTGEGCFGVHSAIKLGDLDPRVRDYIKALEELAKWAGGGHDDPLCEYEPVDGCLLCDALAAVLSAKEQLP